MSDDFHYRPPAGPKRPPRPRPPLTAKAQARLDAMASELPQPGERIAIRWPGGPHDFELVFALEGDPCPYPGWHFLYGKVVSPENWHPRLWAPMAKLVDGEWTMVPHGGTIHDV